MRAITLAKFEDGIVNEDAAIANGNVIAVSDGAGGGGVFADLWSKYLVEHLPDEPITDFKAFDKWIDDIWEPFYNDSEEKAKAEGGMLLNKFYDEGSYATVVAVWNNGQWISYGDSVAFCYNKRTGMLQHSFGHIVEFNNPPHLVNCKDPTDESGFKSGKFEKSEDDIIFAASDALSHYILMMYELSHSEVYTLELQNAINAQTKYSNSIKIAMAQKSYDFKNDIMGKLLSCYRNIGNFRRHMESIQKKGLIAHDDYSIAIL